MSAHASRILGIAASLAMMACGSATTQTPDMMPGADMMPAPAARQLTAATGLSLAGMTTDGLVVVHTDDGNIQAFPTDGSPRVDLGHFTVGAADHGVVLVGERDAAARYSLSVYAKKTGRLVSLGDRIVDFTASDNDRIALVEQEADGTASLVLVNPDGGNRKVLKSGVIATPGWHLRAFGRYLFATWSPSPNVGAAASVDLETDTLNELGNPISNFAWNTWNQLYVLYGASAEKTLVSLAGGPKINITNCASELLAMDASAMLCATGAGSLDRVAFPSGDRSTLVPANVTQPLEGVGDLVLYESDAGVVSLRSIGRGTASELTGYQFSNQLAIDRLIPSGQVMWVDKAAGKLHARGLDTAEVTFGEKVGYTERFRDSLVLVEMQGASADVVDLHLFDAANGQSHQVAAGALPGKLGIPYSRNASSVAFETAAGLFVSAL